MYDVLLMNLAQDIGYVSAKLRALRSRLWEGEDLRTLAHKRSLTELAAAVRPTQVFVDRIAFERQLTTDHVVHLATLALLVEGALVVMTDWLEYRRPDFERIKSLMKSPVVFDARNLYKRQTMKELQFVYYPLGREAIK